ncbi:MAG: hypothetical protein AAFX65_13275 [Cyanobacteria bacterium J06638_7]
MTHPNLLRRGRSLATAAGITLLSMGSALPGLAQDSAPQRLTPAQEAQIFPERKALLVRHQRERIQTLQKSERCVSGAANSSALRRCLQQERQENQAQRQSLRESMREIYSRSGIDVPVGGPGAGRSGRGQGGN